MTLDKSNHPYPWYVVSSRLQDLQTVTGLQMPLQLLFQLPASPFSFQPESIPVKQLFLLLEKKCYKYNNTVKNKEVKRKGGEKKR